MPNLTISLPDGPVEITKLTEEPYRQAGAAAEAPFIRAHVARELDYAFAGTWTYLNLPNGEQVHTYIWKVRCRVGRSTVTLIASDLSAGEKQ